MPESLDIYPIKTAWGLEYNIEAGRLPYEVVWSLDTDLEAAAMLSNGGVSQVLIGDDEVNILDTCDHLTDAIGRALYIVGRSIVIPASEQCLQIGGTPYDAIQISGWGFNPIVNSDKGSVGKTTQTVYLPRDDQNYRDIRPSATTTTILRAGKRMQAAQDYLFPGAYTEAEIVNKVGSELALWDILTNNGTSWDLPFHIPMPLMIGRYEGLMDPKGRPAYFYASLVPFSGTRDGIIFDQSWENIEYLLSRTPRISSALHTLHNYGLAHNQPVMGNINTGDIQNGGIAMIADMATLTPLDLTPVRHPRSGKRIRNYGRAHDLLGVLNGSLLSFNVPRNEKVTMLQDFISQLFFYYGALNGNNAVVLVESLSEILRDPVNLDYYMAEFLDDAEDRGILPKQANIKQVQRHSVGVLNYWQNRMRQISRV